MRNLKKVLSLALAFVMLMGLMIVGAGAVTTTKDYTDGADVNYTEAVDVMSAIGVFDGANGTFAPQGDLTRAQAAKIITYMLLGKEAADKLGTLTAPYTDVAASYWAAGSIAYCTNMGIVSGIGNGQFGPDAQVTGFQFAKMLLVALGYDAEREGLTGSDWSINVSRLALTAALDTGLDSGTDIALDKALTREEAAQMAFNTLKATMVEYATNSSTITVGGTPIVIGGSNATKVTSDRSYAGNFGDSIIAGTATRTLEFGERYFQTLVCSKDENDAFGRPAYSWQYGRDDIGTYTNTSELVMTYTASAKDIAKDLRGYSLHKTDGTVDVTPVVNGKDADSALGYIADDGDHDGDSIEELTGNGIVVEIYADLDRVITDVVVIETELMQISTVNTSSKTVTLKRVGTTGTTAIVNAINAVKEENANYVALSAMKADDYVLVVPVWDDAASKYNVESVAVPQSVTGAITRIEQKNGAATAVTVGGQSYSAAKVADSTVTTAAPNATKEFTIWLDAYGYVVYTDAVAASTRNVVFVVDSYKSLINSRIVDMANVVWSNGETGTIQTDIETTAGNAYAAGDPTNGIYPVTALTTTTSADEYYLALRSDATAEIKAGDRKLNSKMHATAENYFASDVVFIYYDGDGNTAVVKEGMQTVPSIPEHSFVILEKNNSNDATKVVSAVVIFGSATVVNSDTLIYVSSASAKADGFVTDSVTGQSVRVYTYSAYVGGAEQDIVTTNSSLEAGKFYSYAVNEGTGAWTLTPYTSTTGTAVKTGKGATDPNMNRYITVDSVTDLDLNKAIFIDVRSAADKDAKPIELSAKGICDAINAGSVNVSIVYDANTKDVSYVYVEGSAVETRIDPAVLGTTGYQSISEDTAVNGDVELVNTESVTITTGKTLTVRGNLTLNAGELVLEGTGKLVVTGDLTITDGTFTDAAGTEITVSGATTITPSGKTIAGKLTTDDLTVNGTATVTGTVTATGTVTLSAAVTGAGKLTVASFSDDATSAAYAQTSTVQITEAATAATLEAVGNKNTVGNILIVDEASSDATTNIETGASDTAKFFRTKGTLSEDGSTGGDAATVSLTNNKIDAGTYVVSDEINAGSADATGNQDGLKAWLLQTTT